MSLILLAVYIALIFIRPQEWWQPVYGFELVNVTAIATLVVSFPKLMQEQRTFRTLPEIKCALALLLGATLSWVGTFYFGGMLNTLDVFGKVIILYLLIVMLGRTTKGFTVLLWTILLCISWMAVHGIVQAKTGAGFGGLPPNPRVLPNGDVTYQIVAYGIFNDPNDLCLAFIVAVPLLYAAYKASPNGPAKAVAICLIPLVCYGAYLTNSRGGVVGILGMLAAYGIARAKGFRRWIMVSVGGTVVFVIAPSRFAGGMGVDVNRVSLWGESLDAFKSHPIFGVGWRGIQDYTSSYQVTHNSFINTLAELGLLGYIPWFVLIFLTLVHVRRAMNIKGLIGTPEYTYLSGLFSALIGYLTAVYFLTRQYNHVLYILEAMTVAQTLIVCQNHNAYDQVYGTIKKDYKRGLLWALASIPFMWISVRLCNLAGRG